MPQKMDSQRLSQLAGQPVDITVNDGETLDQAEARVMQEHPDVFKSQAPAPQQDMGSELAAVPKTGLQLTPRLQQMQDWLSSADPTSKEYGKVASAFKGELDTYLKMNPGEKPDAKADDFNKKLAGAGKNVKAAYDILDQVETSSGDLPFMGSIYGMAQKAGDAMGINPEVGQYNTLVNGILSTFARNVGQEKGAMSEGDVERAKSIFAPINDNQAERDSKKKNAIIMLQSADPSQDWESIFNQPPSSLLAKKLGQASQGAPAINVDQSAIAAALRKKGVQ